MFKVICFSFVTFVILATGCDSKKQETRKESKQETKREATTARIMGPAFLRSLRLSGEGVTNSIGEKVDVVMVMQYAKSSGKPVILGVDPNAKRSLVEGMKNACDEYGVGYTVLRISDDKFVGPNGEFIQ